MKNKIFQKKKKYLRKRFRKIRFKKKKRPLNDEDSNNIISFNNESNNLIPNNENLLDNYNIIQYKNIKIPRISFKNKYFFDEFKKPFHDLIKKINMNYIINKNFIGYNAQIIDQTPIINNINQNQQIYKNNNPIDNNIEKSELIIEIKNEQEEINSNIDNSDDNHEKNIEKLNNNDEKNFGGPKNIRKLFKLKYYDKNQNLIHKKRGKKPLYKRKEHIHTALDNDNILRKIQVHFLTFLVCFTNDYIDSIFKNVHKKNIPHFRNFDYGIKKIINQEAIEKMKYSTVGEILQKQASRKNKSCAININQITYYKLCQLYPELKYIYFNKLFKEFFIEYYYNKNKRVIILNGVYINLSIRTQGFNTLIKENINFSEKFRNIASCFYNNIKKEENDEDKNITEIKQNDIIQKPLFIIN